MQRSAFLTMANNLREECRFGSVWSAEIFESLTDLHHYPKGTVLLYKEHWGEKEVRVTIEGPTYKDLWAAGERAILESGDLHHIYIELFEFNKDGELELTTGS